MRRGLRWDYNPRMASVPERREVLSRLGIIKGNTDDLFPRPVETSAEFEEESLEGALESLPAEGRLAPFIEQVLHRLRTRNALLLVIAVCAAACAVGAVILFWGTVNSVAPTPASETSLATTGDGAPLPTATDVLLTAASSRVAGMKTRTATPSVSTVRQPVKITRAETAPSEPAKVQDQRLDTRTLLSSGAAPAPSSDAALAALPSNDIVASVPDQTLYSKDNEDVRPPKLLFEQLPTPTIGGWTTRTNVIEVIVSEAGDVERARFVATPQRMPDTFVLSRAKVWKFSPAMKDGRPVRYRLLLSWEVNP